MDRGGLCASDNRTRSGSTSGCTESPGSDAWPNMQLILAALIYGVSAWLVWLNYLNDFHPALSYAIFEMLVGGSIAFTTMRGLFCYLSAAVLAAVVLVSMNPGVMIESLSYLSSMVVVAMLVFLVHYWRSYVQNQFEETAARSVARLKKEAETHRLLVDTAMIATGETELNTGGFLQLRFGTRATANERTGPGLRFQMRYRLHSRSLFYGPFAPERNRFAKSMSMAAGPRVIRFVMDKS